MMEKYLMIILILFHFSSGQYLTNIIVLPFKTYREPYNKLKPLNISSIVNNHIYTEIEISNQTLVASFNSDEYGFYMTDQNCIEKSNYKIQNSKTFSPLTNFNDTKEGFASERMLLYRDIDLKIKNYAYYTKMRITSYNEERQCAIFGLKMKSDVYEFIQSFIKTFKENTNIKYYKWTLKYTSNDEGLLVLGDNPVEYDPKFKKKNYTEHKTNAIIYKTYPNFGLKFDEVIFNNSKLNANKEVQCYHELGVILVDQTYYDKIYDIFFEKYNKICEKLWVFGKYGYIRCDGNTFKDKDIKSFPTLLFKHIGMDYVFELNYEDLFSKEEDGGIYFLIVLDLTHDGIKFGKPFLKKYPFTIDTDLNTISLFIVNEKKKNSKTLIITLIIVSLLFVIVSIFLAIYGNKYIKQIKNTKKRANELDEDYEYEPGKISNEGGLINNS